MLALSIQTDKQQQVQQQPQQQTEHQIPNPASISTQIFQFIHIILTTKIHLNTDLFTFSNNILP